MKNTSKFLALLLMAAITLTSCKDNKKTSDKDEEKKESKADEKKADDKIESNPTNDLKSEALKLGLLACSFQKAIASGDTLLSIKLDKEGAEFSKNLFKKYSSPNEQKEINDILKSELQKCK